MYDSGITAKDFIATVKDEADITIVIPDANWYRWISTVEQILYTEVFKEYDILRVDLVNQSDEVVLNLSDAHVASD